MALPTIRHTNVAASASSSTVTALMTKLHTELLASGWTIEYADADAIGSGSAGTPAWDKTPANNTDAGIAVYRMPLNGHTTQWFLRLRPGWGGATVRVHMRGVTAGVTHDGSGNLSGGGTEKTPAASTMSADSSQYQLAASEDGFALIVGGSLHGVVVERVRRSDTGVVVDDLSVLAYTRQAPGVALVRNGVGAVYGMPPVALGGFSGGLSLDVFGASSSLQNYDGSAVHIVGPFWPRGYPFFTTRHALLFHANDHALNSDQNVNIDGGNKVYRMMGTAAGTNWAVWGVATE